LKASGTIALTVETLYKTICLNSVCVCNIYKMRCENCNTENGYPRIRDNVWFCKKCLHETPLKKEEKQDE